MSSVFRNTLVAATLAATIGCAACERAPSAAGDAPAVLRVCADPNNLPFSNEREEGFENRLAELVAGEMGTTVEYVWWAQRRGFFRNTLNANLCDLVVGVPTRLEIARTTAPYYRSTYVFVTRRDAGLQLASFDDPALRTLRIGVPLIGDDGANAPPAHALSRRGIIRNVVGYSVFGDYRTEAPPSRLITAVAESEIDVALAWGPLAGYYAARQHVPLAITPVQPRREGAFPFTFDISMAVRRSDDALFARVEQIIDRRRADIDAILDEYRVPLVAPDPDEPVERDDDDDDDGGRQ
jgi:mxaJ protein